MNFERSTLWKTTPLKPATYGNDTECSHCDTLPCCGGAAGHHSFRKGLLWFCDMICQTKSRDIQGCRYINIIWYYTIHMPLRLSQVSVIILSQLKALTHALTRSCSGSFDHSPKKSSALISREHILNFVCTGTVPGWPSSELHEASHF